MTQLTFAKVTELPVTLTPNTLYSVASVEANLFDIYLSNSAGTAARHIISKSEIESMVANSISSSSGVAIYANIIERDAATLTSNMVAMVTDATADVTVVSGGAVYVYNFSNTSWVKIIELDAIANSHTHANSSVLNDLSDDGSGLLQYKGTHVGGLTLSAIEW